MTTAFKCTELLVAAYEPGASHQELTKHVIERAMAEIKPDLLLKSPNLWLHELDWRDVQLVLGFLSSVTEEQKPKLCDFASYQLTYALMAGNYEFSEKIISWFESEGHGRLNVYFTDWTDYNETHIDYLHDISSRVVIDFYHDYLDLYWKHLSSTGFIKLLGLLDRTDFEKRVINAPRVNQDRYGGLALLIYLGRVSADVIEPKVQSLIVAREWANTLREDGMSIAIKEYVDGTSLDELARVFTDAISVARPADVQILGDGLILIVGAKTLAGESEQAKVLVERFSQNARPGSKSVGFLDNGGFRTKSDKSVIRESTS